MSTGWACTVNDGERDDAREGKVWIQACIDRQSLFRPASSLVTLSDMRLLYFDPPVKYIKSCFWILRLSANSARKPRQQNTPTFYTNARHSGPAPENGAPLDVPYEGTHLHTGFLF